ncbi:MAG: DNA-binding protein [Candidatus Bathyarchaeia archaeon]
MSEVVLIGRKPASAYVVAVAVALHRADWVKLKARGRAIGKAVNVAEVAKRTLRARVGEIKIGTEALTTEERTRYVSFIEISLAGIPTRKLNISSVTDRF